MTEKTLVVLMGEQPAPLLLSIREQEPDRVLVIYTNKTKEQADNLQEVIAGEVKIIPVESDAYNLEEITKTIDAKAPKEGEVIFDVTGGTKMMSIAAALVAQLDAQQHKVKMTYISTGNSQGTLYPYEYDLSKSLFPIQLSPITPLKKATFTLEEYFKLYLLAKYDWRQEEDIGDKFERAVCNIVKQALGVYFDEVWCHVQIDTKGKPQTRVTDLDVVVRCGIQVGVVEVSLGKLKDAIDQLTSITDRKLLGTYVKRFVVTTGKNRSPISKDQKLQVEIIQVGFGNERINNDDAEKIVNTIRQAMACK